MGNSTEIFVKASIRYDANPTDLSALKYMAGIGRRPIKLPDHDLFMKPGWRILLKGGTPAHQTKPTINMFFDAKGKRWYLCARADFKWSGIKYDELFFDWLKRLVEPSWDRCFMGYSLREGSCEPVIFCHYVR